MTKDELSNWLSGKGYIKDKFGHYQKTFANGVVIRFKMQTNSVRRERKVRIVDHNEWLKQGSGYYANLSITEENKLKGLA